MPSNVASAAIAPMNDVVPFLPAAYTSSSQLLTLFITNPKVTFLRPDLLPVSQSNVIPRFGIAKWVAVFLNCLSK